MIARPEQHFRLFQGIVPALISTCASDGTPNVTIISQVFFLDPKRVALSCQFFNKTKRNLLENPRAAVELWDPVTFEAYRMGIRFLRSESEGALFETMALRIEAIASHTGMAGVFKLRSADVCEVLWFEKADDFLLPEPPSEECREKLAEPMAAEGPLTELRALSIVSARVNRAGDLDALLRDTLVALDELFGFRHSMVLLLEDCGTLVAIASRGYGESGVGAEVRIGEGLVGKVAEKRVPLHVTGVDARLRYSRAIRGSFEALHGAQGLAAEVPLPGLPDAQSLLALPLVVEDRLLGVLAIESRDPLAFAEWHEAFLQVLANQVAIGIDRLDEPEQEATEPAGAPIAAPAAPVARATHRFLYYPSDDCVFAGGEYLIRNVPGKILWKLLRAHAQGQREFTNRELRLDSSLGLPAYKDNLESRLILLKKRLLEKCPGVRIVPLRRGRFALEVDGDVALEEKA